MTVQLCAKCVRDMGAVKELGGLEPVISNDAFEEPSQREEVKKTVKKRFGGYVQK